MTLAQALSEEQATIITRSKDPNYPLAQSIADIDLIADLTELKILARRKQCQRTEKP